MINKNELIFVNRILNAELSIRKAAKQLGLRRDDLIRRIEEMLGDDEEKKSQLELIIIINKMLFDDMKMRDAANLLKISEKELDKRIIKTLENNADKTARYQEYKENRRKMMEEQKKSKVNSRNVGTINQRKTTNSKKKGKTKKPFPKNK